MGQEGKFSSHLRLKRWGLTEIDFIVTVVSFKFNVMVIKMNILSSISEQAEVTFWPFNYLLTQFHFQQQKPQFPEGYP